MKVKSIPTWLSFWVSYQLLKAATCSIAAVFKAASPLSWFSSKNGLKSDNVCNMDKIAVVGGGGNAK